MPFRLIYDAAFGIIAFVLAYTSILIVNGENFPDKSLDFVFPRVSFIIPIILNLNAVFSTMLLGAPDIGFITEDILTQGAIGLLPLLNFIIITAANAIVLYLNIYNDMQIQLYEIPAHLLAVIAAETSIAIYAFHVGGVQGIRWSLYLFHILFIMLTLRIRHSFKTKEIRLKVTCSDLLLILFSFGIFMMIYVPFGIYSLYTDNSVVLSSSLSIVKRGSLQPYYTATSYYTPIMGFISVIFAYTTGLDNLLLSSSLPFLVGSLALPFAIYHFIKSFISDDPRVAIIATIAAALMDGLAVLLLPIYGGKLTMSIINWKISPLTKSLYATNICQLWLTPYKSFANASAMAACSILHKRRAINFMLSGALFFMSFTNSRYSILTLLLLLLLFGTKKIDAKGIALFVLSTIIFSGLTLPVHLYKELLALFDSLYKSGFINETLFNNFSVFIKPFVAYEAFPFIVTIVLVAFLGIFILTRLNFDKKVYDDNRIFTSQFSPGKFPRITIKKDKAGKERTISIMGIIVLGSIFVIFTYAVFQAYSLVSILNFTENPFVVDLNTIVLRYHILIVFVTFGFLTLKCNQRTAITSILILMLFFFGGRLTKSTTLVPAVFAVLALPAFTSFVKCAKKRFVFVFLLFIFLGVFSATFYCATVTAPTITEYTDLPQVLNVLLKYKEVSVYSPSSYTYYARRTVNMAGLRLSSDPSSSLYLIDKDYIKSGLIENFLNDGNFTVLYHGNRFILLARR